MASDGEDISVTPAESVTSATDTEEEDIDSPLMQSELHSDEEQPDVEEVPLTTEESEMDELIKQLEDYSPTIPDALTMHILKTVAIYRKLFFVAFLILD